MLVVYADDFKLAGPKETLAKGWALLRGETAKAVRPHASSTRPKGLGLEPEVQVTEKGTTYLGCRQKKSAKPHPSGGACTVMEYGMEEFMMS